MAYNKPNASWVFDIEYFFELHKQIQIDGNHSKNDSTSLNAKITCQKLKDYSHLLPPILGNIQPVIRTIRGAGLTMGLGGIHEIPSDKDAIQLGFSFDRYSGLPVLRSHMLKGILKSYFPEKYRYEKKKNNYIGRQNYIASILSQITNKTIIPEMIWVVEHSIFGMSMRELQKNSKSYKLKHIPYHTDIFYDCYPIESNYISRLKDDQGCFMGMESLLYEGKKNERFKTKPIPLTFLKVLPMVDIRFDLELHPLKFITPEGKKIEISSEHKRTLLERLINNHPLGAKTSYNFGRTKNKE